jgi:hypothetical protein
LTDGRTPGPAVLVARSKLLAATGAANAALAAAARAAAMEPVRIEALEQEATLVADAGDVLQLEAVVGRLKRVRRRAPSLTISKPCCDSCVATSRQPWHPPSAQSSWIGSTRTSETIEDPVPGPWHRAPRTYLVDSIIT